MILAKTPFRISFFGGGTDFPEYFNEYGGQVIGGTINKFCYNLIRHLPNSFEHKHRLCWSINEDIFKTKDIKHPMVKKFLESIKSKNGFEIFHFSDMPGRSGIGSSSAFCVGLINSYFKLVKKKISKEKLIKEGIHIERKLLKQQTGLQDIVWAVHGGFGKILFNKKKIIYKKLKISKKNLKKLQDNIILINTYIPRYSDAIEKSKIAVIKQNIQHYHQLKEYVDIASKILSGSNLDNFGELLGEYWNIKKTLSSNVSNYKINDIYSEAVKCGAEGGKILGAGGGGMMLIYCPKKSQKKIFERFKKHKPTKIQFCETGSETITKL